MSTPYDGWRAYRRQYAESSPDLMVLDVDLSAGNECWKDQDVTDPFASAEDGVDDIFRDWQEEDLMLDEAKDADLAALLRKLKDDDAWGGLELLSLFRKKHSGIAGRTIVCTAQTEIRKFIRKVSAFPGVQVIGPETLREELRKRFIALIEREIIGGCFDRSLVLTLLEKQSAFTICIDGYKISGVPFYLAPVRGRMQANDTIEISGSELRGSFLLGSLFAPWAKQLRDDRNASIGELRRCFPTLFERTLPEDFSRCFGTGAIWRLAHKRWNNDGPLWAQSGLRQLEMLTSDMESNLAKHSELPLDPWSTIVKRMEVRERRSGTMRDCKDTSEALTLRSAFDNLRLVLRGIEMGERESSAGPKLRGLRDGYFKTRPRDLFYLLCDIAPSGLELKSKMCSDVTESYEVYPCVEELLREPLRNLLVQAKSRGYATEVEMISGAERTAQSDDNPDGKTWLLNDFLALGHRGDECSSATMEASNSGALWPLYRSICTCGWAQRIAREWIWRDFSSGIPRLCRLNEALGSYPQLLRCIESAERNNTYHVLLFKDWRQM